MASQWQILSAEQNIIDDGLQILLSAGAGQFGYALKHCLFPVFRVLLTPAGLGKLQRILLRDRVMDRAIRTHQQQLHGGGAQVDSNI